MSLKKGESEKIMNRSMIEIANSILVDEKKEMKLLDLYDKIATLKQYTAEEKANHLSQFYTDLNMDGRFIALGSNVWGLKRWFPVSQTSEKALADARKRNEDIEEDEDFSDEIDFDSPDDYEEEE